MKLINNWLSPKVQPKKSNKEGNGEFAKENIEKDEIIAIFGGHVMTRDEKNNLQENVRYLPIGINDEMFIGPKLIEEIDDADWFNHSCDPNAGIKGQIMLMAMRDIKRGEEITFDYVMSCSQNGERRILFNCECCLPNCRKEITNLDWKNQELQKKYKGYFSYFVQKNIDELNNEKTE
jgi:SET domain-containing protein